MKQLIVITVPYFFRNEEALVTCLFEEGLPLLHLRKPDSTEKEVEEWLLKIPSCYYPRITLHDHFTLAIHYNIGGIHLNRRNNSLPGRFQGRISRSCHSLEEINQLTKEDYAFLSPIFPSISKEGYGIGFPWEELTEAAEKGIINRRIIALGGINKEAIQQLQPLPFGGYAVLGAIWGNESSGLTREEIKERFSIIRDTL